MTTKTLKEKFEEAFLEGKNRESILITSQLQLGADGEYFNTNTRAMFNFFKKGAASVVVELPPKADIPDGDGLDCDDVDAWEMQTDAAYAINGMRSACKAAIEAAGGTVKS